MKPRDLLCFFFDRHKGFTVGVPFVVDNWWDGNVNNKLKVSCDLLTINPTKEELKLCCLCSFACADFSFFLSFFICFITYIVHLCMPSCV